MMMAPFARHVPVLIGAILGRVAPVRGVWLDGTFGAGGYARALLDAGAERVIGIDRDPDALAFATDWAGAFGNRLDLHAGRFGDLDRIASEAGSAAVDGVVLDIGVSSMQLDRAERGFSFRLDGPLDMRMGDEGPTAADVVNTADAGTLAHIFRVYGEEKRSGQVARAIVEARNAAPFTTTRQLSKVVESVIWAKPHEIHPATRVFQALRIATNRELVELGRFLDDAIARLSLGARLAVLSYHSLEDRIVKDTFRDRSAGCSCPPSFPVCVCSRRRVLALVTRKPVRPSPEEVFDNRRARSARMRVAERVVPGPPRSG